MSSISNVPINDLFTGGQQLRCSSLIDDQVPLKVIPNSKDNDQVIDFLEKRLLNEGTMTIEEFIKELDKHKSQNKIRQNK